MSSRYDIISGYILTMKISILCICYVLVYNSMYFSSVLTIDMIKDYFLECLEL
jgi:hypothetical protein